MKTSNQLSSRRLRRRYQQRSDNLQIFEGLGKDKVFY